MDACKNRRTMRRRVRRAMWICIFMTILLFGGVLVGVEMIKIRHESQFWSSYFSNDLADEMNSQYFKEQMGIKDLSEFDPQSPEEKAWIRHINEKWGNPTRILGIMRNAGSGHDRAEKKPPFTSSSTSATVLISISFNDDSMPMYANYYDADYNLSLMTPRNANHIRQYIIPRLMSYFSTEATSPLFDDHHKVIGYVRTFISPDFALAVFFSMVIIILIAGLIALFISNFIAKLLVIPVLLPIKKLEEMFLLIAAGNYDTGRHEHITFKKPLREIESLIDSTNMIIDKMGDYAELLSSQKDELEAQNEELEAQNIELIESQRQIQETQTFLAQSKQMASVGQLTAAIAHEINTPLGAIHSNVQINEMLLREIKANEHVKHDPTLSEQVGQLNEANAISLMASERVAEIIKSLKTYSKIDQAEFQEADINEGIRSVLVLTSNLWKKRIQIHEEYGSLPKIKCFPGMLNQVFMNIVVNAVQAIEDKGVINIRTVYEKDWIRVVISDSGSGIKPEDLNRIFEPGFSTKGCGVGLGLGLSICRNVVKKHQGEISVKSEVGKGTEFTVSIPAKLN